MLTVGINVAGASGSVGTTSAAATAAVTTTAVASGAAVTTAVVSAAAIVVVAAGAGVVFFRFIYLPGPLPLHAPVLKPNFNLFQKGEGKRRAFSKKQRTQSKVEH